MFRELFKVSSLSFLSALINFGINFLIVDAVGLGIFGEFSLLNSQIALITIVTIVIPPSWAVFSIQDNDSYRVLYGLFFVLVYIFVLIGSVLFFALKGGDISLLAIVIFVSSLVWQKYFDVTLQADGKLRQFYYFLLALSLSKGLVVFGLNILGIPIDINVLVLALGLAQISPLIVLAVSQGNNFEVSKNSLRQIKDLLLENFALFKSYYLNVSLKRLQEHVVVISFSYFVSDHTIGEFALFVKILAFTLGLSRVIEMLFNNRESIAEYFDLFRRRVFVMGVFLQSVFLITGLVYMKLLTEKWYFIELIIMSCLLYIFSYAILARAHFLAKYNTRYLNNSSLIYIITTSILLAVLWLYTEIELRHLLVVYCLSNIFSNLYLIVQFKSHYVEKSNCRNIDMV